MFAYVECLFFHFYPKGPMIQLLLNSAYTNVFLKIWHRNSIFFLYACLAILEYSAAETVGLTWNEVYIASSGG